MSGKTLNKQLKWNLHHSHLCQNISQPHSLKIFYQDYLWQSHLLYISKRYEIDKIKTTWRRTCSVSEGSRDFSVLKWLLCTKSPNLFNFTGLKILMFSFKPSQDFQVLLFHQNTYRGFLNEVQRNMQNVLARKTSTHSGKTCG